MLTYTFHLLQWGGLLLFLLISALPQTSQGQDMIPGPVVQCPGHLSDTPIKILGSPRLKSSVVTAQFIVDYTGFSPQAQAAFQHAVDIWATALVSTVPIEIVAVMSDTLDLGILGSAGPTSSVANFEEAPQRDVFYPSALANALAERDLQPGKADIQAVFNGRLGNWYFGLDGTAPVDSYDFVTLVLHELAHGLGFIGSARLVGEEASLGNERRRSLIYDRFIENENGTALSNLPSPSAQLRQALESNQLFFAGVWATQANRSVSPRIYAPSPFDGSSSYSHWDESTFLFNNTNSLMTPFIRTGETIHEIGDVTSGLMRDIGWSVNSGGQVILSNFRVQRTSINDVGIRWATVAEADNRGFVVQRAFSEDDFVDIAFIAGRETETSPQVYQFTDVFQLKPAWYRLMQVNQNQSFVFTESIFVPATTVTNPLISPNPSGNPNEWAFNLGSDSNPEEQVEIQVVDGLGKVLIRLTSTLSDAQQILKAQQPHWLPGLYILQVRTATKNFSRRFIIL
ncbi:MAG: T9SS type A sorting domain-containing protein [Bacteroidia bacterium]|nr:T9SS type A sorting domain-containing protein [Bacteroidia bacterium]